MQSKLLYLGLAVSATVCSADQRFGRRNLLPRFIDDERVDYFDTRDMDSFEHDLYQREVDANRMSLYERDNLPTLRRRQEYLYKRADPAQDAVRGTSSGPTANSPPKSPAGSGTEKVNPWIALKDGLEKGNSFINLHGFKGDLYKKACTEFNDNFPNKNYYTNNQLPRSKHTLVLNRWPDNDDSDPYIVVHGKPELAETVYKFMKKWFDKQKLSSVETKQETKHETTKPSIEFKGEKDGWDENCYVILHHFTADQVNDAKIKLKEYPQQKIVDLNSNPKRWLSLELKSLFGSDPYIVVYGNPVEAMKINEFMKNWSDGLKDKKQPSQTQLGRQVRN